MITIGSVVGGKYRLVRLLGDGGMGSVYEALHTGLGSRVAVKVLHPELARRTGLVERFLQEARVAAQIRSPHVVHVTDVDRTPDGDAYIVMDLLEGEPLSSVMDRQRKLPPPLACDYAMQILEALEAAHALGVIHRDLKPENVFVTFASGKPVLKLIDFGIAKARRTEEQKSLTVAGMVMGTAEYMAPEQARSADKVDARADVYAVGVMLYEMIAGARPVTGEDARVIAYKVERGEVIPLLRAAPDAPREIAGLVHRAMAARPELRFPSATDMRRAVEEIVSGKRAAGGGLAASLPIPRPASVAPPVAPVAQLAAEIEPPVNTVRSPPMATALQPPAAYGAPPVALAAAPAPTSPRPRRRRGVVMALVGLPVLVGAGVVGILFATGQCGSAPDAAPVAPTPPGATSTATAPQALAATTDTRNELPALVPGRPTPAPRSQSSSHTSAEAGASPAASAAPDASRPSPLGLPTDFPSTLPPFPSGFPAGFPTSFPGLPSSFPSAFPGWPPMPQPAPAPTRAPPPPNGAAI